MDILSSQRDKNQIFRLELFLIQKVKVKVSKMDFSTVNHDEWLIGGDPGSDYHASGPLTVKKIKQASNVLTICVWVDKKCLFLRVMM